MAFRLIFSLLLYESVVSQQIQLPQHSLFLSQLCHTLMLATASVKYLHAFCPLNGCFHVNSKLCSASKTCRKGFRTFKPHMLVFS